MAVSPPPMTSAGSSAWRLASASFLKAPGQLQGHQEVGGLADAADDVVLDGDDRGPPRARGHGDVVETEVEGLLGGQGAAKPHAALDREPTAPGERQVDQGEEVLVPADRDAVLRDAAESGQRTAVERTGERAVVADGADPRAVGPGPVGGQALDLQAVDPDDAEALVDEVVREGVAGRAEADDEDVLAVVGGRVGARRVQGIPARQQAVDLDAPGQRQHVGQGAGLDLRDVDRLLLLEDAALHAVVADAVARARAHRVVDADEGERADGVALAPQLVHLRDLLVERTAGQGHAERVLLEAAGLGVGESLRAGVLLPFVAEQAVVRLAEDLAPRHARDRSA